MKKFSHIALVLLTIFTLSGCSTAKFPQNANNVAVVNRDASYTANCKPLGTVSSEINPWEWFGLVTEAQSQVIFDMRADAYERFGADTIILNHMGQFNGSATALKCFNK
ncbi:hypothetical protein [Gulbenkiania mobilis]|uniref:hypothetical protein n=1 Tax=Gulbenkiania mobilis TaxID=397457 RepID=UPI00104740D7